MEDLLKKIRALHTMNIEIVELIESRSNKVWYEYEQTWVNGKLEINEIKHSISVQSLCDSWKRSETEFSANDFEENLLVFAGHKVKITANTWDELKALNGDMSVMFERISPLLSPESSCAVEVLRNYLTNFELLQVDFGSIDELTTSHESEFEEVNKQRDLVNQALDRISSTSRAGDRFPGSTILSLRLWDLLRVQYGPSFLMLYRMTRDGKDLDTIISLFGACTPIACVLVIKCTKGFVFGMLTNPLYHPSRRFGETVEISGRQPFTLQNPHNIGPVFFGEGRNSTILTLVPASNGEFLSGSFFGGDTASNEKGPGVFTHLENGRFQIAEMEMYTGR